MCKGIIFRERETERKVDEIVRQENNSNLLSGGMQFSAIEMEVFAYPEEE